MGLRLAQTRHHDAKALRVLGKHLFDVIAPDEADAREAAILEAEAAPTASECLLSLQVATPDEVDGIAGRVVAAGGQVVSGPEQKSWGYTATFTDPDGHLWEAIDSAI